MIHKKYSLSEIDHMDGDEETIMWAKKINRNGEIEKYLTENNLVSDTRDIDFYVKLFDDLGRDPYDVELFDLCQSNSEHSRHWFFKGKMVNLDGNSLLQITKV